MAATDADGDAATLLRPLVRDVVDYPSPGVVFKDITPLLAEPRALGVAVRALAEPFEGRIDLVAAIEARGFLLAAPVAVALGAGVVPLRKLGKLPWSTMSESYELEYGAASLEVHLDAVAAGHRVLVVDDIVATGGTAAAAVELVRRAGGTVVGLAALLDIAFLGGRARLAPLVPELHVLFSV
ncbi:MAG TPA: adenine phosphoribosyltransferase [Acidimicrobiales bacterium]|nr:adenine phosphoribosyltransferase [Acidimicrobiales bacterium]